MIFFPESTCLLCHAESHRKRQISHTGRQTISVHCVSEQMQGPGATELREGKPDLECITKEKIIYYLFTFKYIL